MKSSVLRFSVMNSGGVWLGYRRDARCARKTVEKHHVHSTLNVDPGAPVVIILATGSEVRGFKSGRGSIDFSERKNLEHDFFRKGSKAVGPVS